ncbi:hypothetical protein [Clostridioides difficile]|uniref:hypothetical protein n=1 Tax=Clostridioides difficile TaxID=1496 RepID=UPI001033A96D|nr:hypothetical protein [Clostridioides difficile]MDM9944047.1 hypothetical protein [Clostridioides difficile]
MLNNKNSLSLNEMKIVELYENIFNLYDLRNFKILENINLDSLSNIMRAVETNSSYKFKLFNKIDNIKMATKLLEIFREINELLYYHSYIEIYLNKKNDLSNLSSCKYLYFKVY